ncbi:FUSC family protein [Streptomyces sp. NPDC006475]|uniref:FUSC family protein n=1 Tax=Streptomyces sp. NPDC006475 TaxID=3155719 RepID=UPI0033AFF196
MSWLRALKETARSGLTLERQRLEPLVALRGALGLALVVAGALSLFGTVVAVSAAFGAFQAAIATYQRSWRPRPVLALASGASLAVSTFIGYLTAFHLVFFVAMLALWTFLAGLAWALGPTVGIIAASNVAIMLVTVTLPTSIAAAAGHAAVIAAGGVVQAALVVLLPVRRWGAQRDALADALAAEADYARRLRHDPTAPFDPAPLMQARRAAAVTRRQARRRPAELHGMRGVAERIRPVLAALADPAVGVPAEGPERDRVRELLSAAASVLTEAARAVRHNKPLRLPPSAVAALKTPDTAAVLTGPARRGAHRLAALLDDVTETARGAGTTEGPHRDRPPLLRLVPGSLRILREELHRDSPVLRHACRVSAVTAVGYIVGTVLPLGHGYWAPMTCVMVMRPDFSQTYARSVARFGGTLIGVGAATAVVQGAGPGTCLSGGLAVLCAFCAFLVLGTGYVASSVFISAYVVLLLGMGGEDWNQTVPERALLTLAGGVLAMIAYAVYPAWETPRLRHRLADWLHANGDYAAAVVDHYADPAGRAGGDIRQTLLDARDARIAWRESVKRAEHEPVRNRGLSRDTAERAGEAISQLGRGALLMEAHLPDSGAAPVPAAADLAEALRRDTERAATAVRERRTPQWDAVHEALDHWDRESAPDTVLRTGAGLVAEALDDLTEALEPEDEEVRGGAGPRTRDR